MKTTFVLGGLLAALLPVCLVTSAPAIDLLQQYPTTLTTGDDNGSHARSCEFTPADIYQVSQFEIKVGGEFKVATGTADVGIGHCADGAVWAVVIPHEPGTLTSSAAQAPEAVAHVWLRFHPGQINRVFPPETVLAAGNTNLSSAMRKVAWAKINTSWQAGGKAMIPEPKDMTVYPDTKGGTHRFFIVDTKAQTADYVAAFDTATEASQVTWESAPPVVIHTIPEAGADNVPPGSTEIRVTFSKAMTDGSWSWCDAWENSTPMGEAKPKYEAGQTTCVLKVKLEPGRAYGYWLNTKSFRNFKDHDDHPAVPYLLTFKTATNSLPAGSDARPTPATTPATLKPLPPIPAVQDLPGTLTFHGHYQHRSRGVDLAQPSELWLKTSADNSVTALAQLPFSNSVELADARQHRLATLTSTDHPGDYQIDLQFDNGVVHLDRRGIREDCADRELKVPSGAWFDPNTRPDSYCAANILLRAFAVGKNETKEFRAYDWDNSGNELVGYSIQIKHAGQELITVPAGTFTANHLVLTQVSSANTWFKKRAGHVTDFWVLDNHVIVRILRHREPYEVVLLDYDVPNRLPGLDNPAAPEKSTL